MKANDHSIGVISGEWVTLREVRVDDARFIVELRTSEKGKRFLHATENDTAKQEAYIRHYLTLNYEWYFIVEDKQGNRVGCLGLYDKSEDSIRKGRWVMKDQVDYRLGIEADYLVRKFAFDELDVENVKSDLMLENYKNITYHKVWGCKEERRDNERIFYNLSKRDYILNAPKIQRFFENLETGREDGGAAEGLGHKTFRMIDEQTFAAAVADALEMPLQDVHFAAYADTPSWDSLGHVGVVAAVENALGVKFSPDEIAKFRSYEDGVKILKEKGVDFHD